MPDIDHDRYRIFLEDIADGFFETNLKGDFIFFNNAFCNRIFGYPSDEMKNQNYRMFMDEETTHSAFKSFNGLYKKGSGVAHTTWKIRNKDGKIHILDVSAELIVDKKNEINGFRGIAHDITEKQIALEKSLKMQRCNQILFRISEALHHYHRLDDLIALINKEIQKLIDIEGAFVLLVDEDKNELYFFSALYGDSESEKKFKEIRFPADQGVSGRVCKTGKPVLIPDVSTCPYFLKRVDDETDLNTESILSVPIKLQDRTIGVLTVVNKLNGDFDQTDIELLSTIASTIALPIENTRINEELRRSNEDLSSLNRAKDRVIHHLSHELKTPVAVLSGTIKLLKKKMGTHPEERKTISRILKRGERNLNRILNIQYEVEDLLKNRNHQAYHLLLKLADACRDEFENLVENETENQEIIANVQNKIETLFGPKEMKSETMELDSFLKKKLELLAPEFKHRNCTIITNIQSGLSVFIPEEILSILIKGLIRNALENTPDSGKIEIITITDPSGPMLTIRDYGVGLTKEKQHLIFENYFTAPETSQYATRMPYDFNAGGKGFDLLRMKIFSERYGFRMNLISKRCGYIPKDEDTCPGDIKKCDDCHDENDCFKSGGTRIDIIFRGTPL